MNTHFIKQCWEEKKYTKILAELPPLKKLTQFQKPVQKELINLWAKVSLHASQESSSLTHFKTGVACTFSALENPIESLKETDPQGVQGVKEALIEFFKELIEDFETKKICKDKSGLLKFLAAEQEALDFLKHQIKRFPDQYQKWVTATPGQCVLAVTPCVAALANTSATFYGFLCEVLSDKELQDLKTFVKVARFSPYALALYCIVEDDAKGAFRALVKQPFSLTPQKTKISKISSLVAQMIFFERGFKEYTELDMHCTKVLTQAKDFLQTFPELSERFDAVANEDLEPHVLNAYASFLEKVFKQCDLPWFKKSLAKLLALKAQNIFKESFYKNVHEFAKAAAAGRSVLKQARELDPTNPTVQEVGIFFNTQDFITDFASAIRDNKFSRTSEMIQDKLNHVYKTDMLRIITEYVQDLNDKISSLELERLRSEDEKDALEYYSNLRKEVYKLLELLDNTSSSIASPLFSYDDYDEDEDEDDDDEDEENGSLPFEAKSESESDASLERPQTTLLSASENNKAD